MSLTWDQPPIDRYTVLPVALIVDAVRIAHLDRPLLDWYLDVGVRTANIVVFAVPPPPDPDLLDDTIELLRQRRETNMRSVADVADHNLRSVGYGIAYEVLAVSQTLNELSPEGGPVALPPHLVARIDYLRRASLRVISAVAFEHQLVWEVLVEQGLRPDVERAVRALFPDE